MSRKFDEKQQVILDCSTQNQLVSAGAGSGKTTVMIKKIADILLNKKAKPSQIVVLTFTNLAGQEMKQRLIASFNQELNNATTEEDKKFILGLLDEINTSYIDTIDGFCSKMCSKYFYKLNSNPNINIATGLALDYYRTKSLDLSIENALNTNREQVINLADCFEKGARSLDSLKTNLLNAFYFVMAQEDLSGFINLALNEYDGYNKSANYLNSYLLSTINKCKTQINYYIKDLSMYEAFYSSALNVLNVLEGVNKDNLINNIKLLQTLPKLGVNRIKDEDKPSYNIVRSNFNIIFDIAEDFAFILNLKNDYIFENKTNFETFIILLNNFITTYQEMKAKYNVVDFADLERNMLTLLTIPDIQKDIVSEFKYIFVDEYQDINPMQNQIISKLKSTNTNIFFVGDVKQSIYGFRQSTPELFLQMYNQYKTEQNSQAFDMNINFRSNPKILEFNNIIFNKLMTEEKTDINYLKNSQFEPKREDFEQTNSDVEIAIFDSLDDEETATGIYSIQSNENNEQLNACERESLFIANKINELVNTDFYDSALKQTRKLQFNDIAILSRSVNDSKTNTLIEVLRKNNIPINIVNKIELSKSESITMIVNILKVISNCFDDVAFTTYLKSNLVNISFDEIFSISTSSNEKTFFNKCIYFKNNFNNVISEKLKYALYLLDEIKANSACLNNSQLINMLLNKYHLKQYILNSTNGENELFSLTNFVSSLGNKENNLMLEEFISYIETNINNKTDYSQTDEINSVTIQTIHASKGLEYPVVILFNSHKKFKPNNDREDLNFDTELGIGMHYFNLDKRTKTDSLPRFAINLKNKIKCYKEELRLLYVATTRPQNKLIITGAIKFDNIEKNKLSLNNFIELIYSVFQNHLNTETEKTELNACTIYQFKNYNYTNHNAYKKKDVSLNINGKSLNFVYPNLEQCGISLKNNVTAISSQINEDYNILPKKLNLTENLSASISSSAQLGTLYHSYLSKMDFTGEFVEFKTDEIDINLLKLAHNKISPLAQNCKNISHEAQFMMYVPYNSIYKDSQVSNKVLVQGIVDMLIEFEDHFILIDFKYSKRDINQLKERYSTQLNLYKMAIENCYNKPVTQSYIYKINSGELI